MTQPRRIAYANQKGGVGKTMTVLGVASAVMNYLMELERLGRRDETDGGSVLVVDCDPQANATKGLGVDPSSDIPTVADVVRPTDPVPLLEAIVPTRWDFVDLIAANSALANSPKLGPEVVFNLDVAFEGIDLSMYRGVLIDTSPTLGDLLFLPLCAADELVIVTEPAVDSVSGTGELVTTAERIKKRSNPRLELTKIIINGEAAQPTRENKFRKEELRQAFGDLVSPHVVRRYATRGDAHSARTPIHLFSGDKSAYFRGIYDDLAREQGLIPNREAAA